MSKKGKFRKAESKSVVGCLGAGSVGGDWTHNFKQVWRGWGGDGAILKAECDDFVYLPENAAWAKKTGKEGEHPSCKTFGR